MLAQKGCLRALREVLSAKMELSYDGWKFKEDDLGASSVSCSRISIGWVRLDSLTDRCESVGTEDGDGIGDSDIGA